MQKLIGHRGVVWCVSSDDGKLYFHLFFVSDIFWEVDGSQKKSACYVLAVDSPTIFIDSNPIGVGNAGMSYGAGRILRNCAIPSPQKSRHLWRMDSLRMTGCCPHHILSHTTQFFKPGDRVVLDHGLLIKLSFQKIFIQCGTDVKLNSFMDGILLPMTQSRKSKNESEKKNSKDEVEEEKDTRVALSQV